MPTLAPEVEIAAETLLVIAPWLADVPVLGRIISSLAGGGGNELQALEKLQAQINKTKTDRDERIKRNGRYVLKAADAMQCVENNLQASSVLLATVKSLVGNIAGRPPTNAIEIVENRIFDCIESKVLKQTNVRKKKKEITYFARPAKGHGKGRLPTPGR